MNNSINFFIFQVIEAIQSHTNKKNIYEILSELKSEVAVRYIFDSIGSKFDEHFVASLIRSLFKNMKIQFKHDCFQYNAHMNYLKVPNILKQCVNLLTCQLDKIYLFLNEYLNDSSKFVIQDKLICDNSVKDLLKFTSCLGEFLKELMTLEEECLIYAEASAVYKFFNEHIFNMISFERLIDFGSVCAKFIEQLISQNSTFVKALQNSYDCLLQIMKVRSRFEEYKNLYSNTRNLAINVLNSCCALVEHSFENNKNEMDKIIQVIKISNNFKISENHYAKAIYLAKFVECIFPCTLNKLRELSIDLCDIVLIKVLSFLHYFI